VCTSPNAEQIRLWNELAGPRWARLEQTLDAQFASYATAILRAAAPRAAEHAIDVGCGSGALSAMLAECVGPTGSVLGVDVSEPLLERARARLGGLRHVSFATADAQEFEFEPGRRDLVCSRFGVMFFADPSAAFRNLLGALRRGGRISFMCWDELKNNDWARVPFEIALQFVPPPPPKPAGTPGPFSMSDPERTRSVLEAAGFENIVIQRLDEPLRVGGGVGVAEAVELFLEIGPGAAVLREAEALPLDRVRQALEAALAGYERPEKGVEMGASAWLVSGQRA